MTRLGPGIKSGKKKPVVKASVEGEPTEVVDTKMPAGEKNPLIPILMKVTGGNLIVSNGNVAIITVS